jgi:hypothetical protein
MFFIIFEHEWIANTLFYSPSKSSSSAYNLQAGFTGLMGAVFALFTL